MPKPGYPFLKPVRWEGDVTELPLIPRRTPRTPPQAGIFDEPFVCVPMNLLWLPHIWGALDVLNQPDTWQGTEAEQFTARQQIERLLLATVEGADLCKPAPQMIPVPEIRYPAWLGGGPGCWVIDTGDLDGELNIIQRVDVDYCDSGEWCPPDDWIVQPESGGESDVSAVDINNLQQQIDAQQQQIDDLQSVVQVLTQQIEDSDAARIASIRWYPVASAAPDGWVSIAGQRIALGSKPLPDAQTLYDRVPASWRDGGDVLLPNYIDILPVSGTADNQNVAFPLADGAAAKYWLYNTQQTGTRNVNAVRGRWMIYIGDAQIS